jgi:predicted MFS family arabinose efflux permease
MRNREHNEWPDGKQDRRWIFPFAAILIAMMAIQMSSLGFSPLLPAIQRNFRLTYTQMGLFTGIYGLIATVLSIPAGMLAARFGEKRIITGGLLIVALGLFCLSMAPTFPLALTSRIVWLCGYRVAFISIFAAILLTAPGRLRGSAIGILGAVAALASVVGAPFGTLVARQLNWRYGIAAFSVMAALGGVIFALFYNRRPGGQPHEAARHPVPHASAHTINLSVYKNPSVWALMLIGLGNTGGFAATFFIPSAVAFIFHRSALDAALIISTAYMLGIFTNLLVGYLGDRFGAWNVMAGVLFVLVVAAFGLSVPNLLLFRICTALVIALGLSSVTQSYNLMAQVVPRAQIAAASGVVAMSGGIFGYLGPQMLGILRDRTGGFTAGWYFIAGTATIAFAVVILLKWRVQSRRNEDHLEGVSAAGASL